MPHLLRREDLSFVDRARIVVHGQRVVDAPADRVWPRLADATAWPAWMPGMAVARYTSPEPAGVGSMRHVEVRALKVEEEVLAFDENERFAFVVLEANLPGLAAMVEIVTLAPAATGTRVTYRQAIELATWARPLAPLLRWQLRSSLQAALANLDALVTGRS